MTIQEEIREGIAKFIWTIDSGTPWGYADEIWAKLPEPEKAACRNDANILLMRLHSQGVVIKVTQKYPLQPPFIYEPLIEDDK